MKKSDGAGMKIQFIGTGAADFDWSEYGKPGVLGSTSTLLDDHVLIDGRGKIQRRCRRNHRYCDYA